MVQLVIPLRGTSFSKKVFPPSLCLVTFQQLMYLLLSVEQGASSFCCSSRGTSHFPNSQSQRRSLVSLVVTALVCLCSTSHLGLIIWHIALQAFPCLSNHMFPNPVLYISSLIAHLFQFGLSVGHASVWPTESPNSKERSLTRVDGTGRLSRNFGEELSLYAA